MYYLLLLTLALLYCRAIALVTVLCNELEICSGSPPICTYLQAGCALYDNGEFKLAKYNNYPISYHSGGFDQNGYHIEFYFGEDWSVSIETPNGGKVSKMRPAGWDHGYLYFAFNDKPLEQGAEDARNACENLNRFPTLALSCDDVYNEALKVYKPN